MTWVPTTAAVFCGFVIVCLLTGVPLALPFVIVGIGLGVGLAVILLLRIFPANSDPANGKWAIYIARGAAVVVAIPGLVGSCTSGILVDGSDDFISHWLSIVAAPLLVAPIVYVCYLFRRTPMAKARLLELTGYLAVICIALIGVLRLANERLDESGARTYEVKVLAAYRTHTARGSPQDRMLRFESWRGRPHEEYSVDIPTYNRAEPHRAQRWNILVRDGWLGHPWIQTMRPIESPTKR